MEIGPQQQHEILAKKYFKMLGGGYMDENTVRPNVVGLDFVSWAVKRKENFLVAHGVNSNEERVAFWKFVTWRKTMGRSLDVYEFKKDEWKK